MADEPSRTRPFADVLTEINRGRDHTELSNELQALVQAVRDTGKKGSLTLSLTVVPSKVDNGLEIIAGIKTTLPKFDRSASLFFADEEGNLTRTDPRQLTLPLGPTLVKNEAAETPTEAASE